MIGTAFKRPAATLFGGFLLLAGMLMPLAAQDNDGGTGASGTEEDSQVEKFRKQFDTFDLTGKQGLIENLADRENPGKYVDVFLDAILWMESTQKTTDLRIREIGKKSMAVIKKEKKSEAAPALWTLFRLEDETYFRISILDTLGAIVTEEQDGVIRRMNRWLEAQNSIYRDRSRVNEQVFYYALRALQQIGDPDSYSVFLEAYYLQITGDLQTAARQACLGYGEDQKDLLLRILEEKEPRMRKQALLFGLNRSRISEEAKTELAVQAIRNALDSYPESLEGRKQLREMRYAAAAYIKTRGYTGDTGLIIAHFDKTLDEYNRGIGRRDYLMDAVVCLGNAGDTAAAERLTAYMKGLNMDKVNGETVDKQIVIAVLENIIKIGDMVSFDLMQEMKIQDNYAGEIEELILKAIDTIIG